MIKKLAGFIHGAGTGNTLARGSFLAFMVQGMGAGLILLTEIVAARLLGVSEFGLYSMVAAWIYVLALVGALGYNHALLRFVPAYAAHDDWGSLRGVVRYANAWAGSAALLMALAAAVLLWVLPLEPAIVWPFAIALVSLPFQVLSSLRQAVLRGMDSIGRALIPDFILRPAIFIALLFGAAWLYQPPLTAKTAFVLSLAAAALVFLIGILWQYQALREKLRGVAPIYHGKEWLATAIPLWFLVGLTLISNRIDVIMLGMLSEVENVAIYTASSRVADVIVFGLVSANAIAAPMIARLYATGRYDELQKMVRLTAKGIFFFTMPIALAVLLFGPYLLRFFGQDFPAGYPVLAILVAGQLVNALAGPVGSLMTMTGHQTQAAQMTAVAAALNLLLNFCLIPLLGMIGAAIATAVGIATWNILMLRFVKSKLSLDASVLQLLASRA